MFGLVVRLVGGIFTPLIDKLSAASARLLRKLALFLVALVAMVVVLIALTIAFALWIASLAGPIVGVLAVAGLYFVVGLVALLFALRKPRAPAAGAATAKNAKDRAGNAKDSQRTKGLDSQIDDFAAPLLGILQRLGLRREQLAVLAGTSVAKQLGPVPLVGLAIVAGFLIGRMWDGWRTLLSADALAAILSTGFASRDERDRDEDDRAGA